MALNRLRVWFGSIVGESDSATTNNLFKLFLVAVGTTLCVFVFVSILMGIACKFPPTSQATCSYGELGDLFGGILNPILTFLAFMGLLITIAVQKDELSQTRDQLKDAAVAQQEIAKLQKKEIANTTLHGLLESMRVTGNEISLSKEQSKGLSLIHI